MNLQSPPVDILFHSLLDMGFQTISLGFWALASLGLALFQAGSSSWWQEGHKQGQAYIWPA